MLFPDPLQFILPDVTVTLNIPPQCDAVQVPLGSANLPRGIVTDLYESVWDDWEGFINAVYRFTIASCHCACPVHLECIVKFQLTPEKSAALVVDRSLGYIALALSRGYPSKVAQNQQIFRIEESTTTFVGASSELLQSLHISESKI